MSWLCCRVESDVHVLKDFFTHLANPLLIATLTGVIAALCRGVGWRSCARWLLGVALLVAYLGSIPVVGNMLLRPLERKYAALDSNAPPPQVKYVVVLGSGYTPRPGVPVAAALSDDGLVRIVEGVRLMRRLAGARLVVSGGAPPGGAPPALGYALVARDLGIDAGDLTVLSEALDTRAEATAIGKVVGQASFILVTSAFHMPRAMQIMTRVGLHPIPAPTDQRIDEHRPFGWHSVSPDWGSVRNVQRSLHEYLGLAALSMRLE